MPDPTSARQAADLLLASMFLYEGPMRRKHQFMYGKPGSRPFMGQSGIDIHYEQRPFLHAVLYVRRHAAPHLRSLSVNDVGSRVTKFVVESFWIISAEAWMIGENKPFSELLSEPAKAAFATAMAASSLFMEPRELTLFPLTTVRVTDSFTAPTFFLIPAAELTAERLEIQVRPGVLAPDRFPPFADDARPDRPVSWLGVWAANLDAASRNRAAVLGAAALRLSARRRYLFSGRTVIGGRCTIRAGSYEISSTAPHTPQLYHDLTVSDADQAWLTILAEKLTSDLREHRREMRALEYLYRPWAPDPVRRFPTLFAALDAVFGEVGRATEAVVAAVKPLMGGGYDDARLRLLLKLRASVVHGGAPNVYDAKDYHRYYERYERDATSDLEEIVGRCLQSLVFGSALVERDD